MRYGLTTVFRLMLLLLLAAGCAKKSTPEAEVAPARRTLVQKKGPEPLRIKYSNQTTQMDLALEMEDEVIVDMRGMRLDSTQVVADSAVLANQEQEQQARQLLGVQRALKNYRMAQEALLRKQYDKAMLYIDACLLEGETAEALAFKGSVFYLQGNKTEAKKLWQKARQLDPDMPDDVYYETRKN